jgi:hypothetical protein
MRPATTFDNGITRRPILQPKDRKYFRLKKTPAKRLALMEPIRPNGFEASDSAKGGFNAGPIAIAAAAQPARDSTS